MDYGEILATAWKITWKNKILWLFGILIGFTQAANVGNQIFRITMQSDLLPPSVLRNLVDVFDIRSPGFWIGLVLLMCGLMVFLLVLTSVGQTGLIKGIALADNSENNSPISFGVLVKALKTYFWRIFGLSLVVGFGFLFVFSILYGGIIAAVVGGVFATRGSGSTAILPVLLLGFVCLLPLLCVFILVSWAASALIMFAMIAIINDDLGILAAFGQGFKVIKTHFWKVLLVILLLAVIGGLIGTVLALPLSFTSIMPLMTLENGRMSGPIVWISILGLLAYTPILVFISAVLSVYSQAVWTLAYRRLSKPAEVAAPVQPVVEPSQE
jgi:hypothetical protein